MGLPLRVLFVSTVEVIFLGTAVITFATGLVIVAINPGRIINRSYLLTATLSSLWLFCIFVAVHMGQSEAQEDKQQEILFWLRMTNAVAAFLPCSYFLLKAAIAGVHPAVGLRNSPLLWIAVSFALAALAFSESFIPSSSTPKAHQHGIGYTIYILSLCVLCILLVYDAVKAMRKSSGISRLEIKFFVVNLALSTLASLVTFVASSVLAIPALRYAVPFIVVVSFSLTMWAICYHRIFDARQVFATLSRRLSTLAVLTACIHIANSYLSHALAEPIALTVSACCGGLLATYWDRKAGDWLGLNAKQILEKPRAQIVEWAREEGDLTKLTAKFGAFLRDWSQAESVSFHTLESLEPPNLILRTSNYTDDFPLLRQTGYITAETLSRRRPDKEIHASMAVLNERNLAALIAVPRGSHSPSCVVAFTPKHSLRPYTYPDTQLLIELIELMDNILSQARVAMHSAQIEKMAAAAMMSRGLAHDLNNLTTPVSTFLLHMENRVAQGSAEAAVLADAKHSIKVMQDYIRESLFFARRLVPDFQTLSMTELMHTIINVTHGRAKTREIKVVIESATALPFLGDRALILRLMQNLVHNGIDATPRGGKVTMWSVATECGRVRFSVADEGSGIPSEHVENIFKPYFTTKDTGSDIRGLGLGLAISQKISDLHVISKLLSLIS